MTIANNAKGVYCGSLSSESKKAQEIISWAFLLSFCLLNFSKLRTQPINLLKNLITIKT